MSKEIEYQNQAQAHIETWMAQRLGRSAPILTEEFSTTYDDVLQSNTWVISKSLVQFNLIGLRDKIYEFNHSSIAKQIQNARLNLSIDIVVNAMVADFEQRFANADTGYDTHQLIFSPNTLQTDAAKRRVATIDGVEFLYDVIYYEWMNGLEYQGKNVFSVIREKRIEVPGQGTSHQRPDFAVYINGIPFLFIEYKTEESGLKKAVADLENKSTYRKVPFYVATNGHECAVICNIEQFNIKDSTNANAYLWKVHRRTPETTGLTDIACFYHDVLCQSENLYFYATQTTSLDHTEKIVKNGRVQQYYAIKKFHEYLRNTRTTKTRKASNLAVFHTQRSGKTVTMKMMAQLVLNHYNDLFQYIFIYAPDLQIKKVLTAEINTAEQSNLVSIQVIGGENSIAFEKALELMHANTQNAHAGIKRIFIVNMQQLKVSDAEKLSFSGLNVLNIIDEGHHGQAGNMAEAREKVLPNATNILFTATPKKDTYVHYLGIGEEADAKILDRFTFTQAKAADIVVNVLYVKPKTFVDALKKSGKLGKFLDLAEKELGEKFEDDATLYDSVSTYAEDPTFANSVKARFAQGLMHQMHQDLVPAKIDQIVSFQKEVKASLTREGNVLFEPKAIVYTRDIAQAKAYIHALRALNGGTGNVYKGFRFALDYAALDQDTSLVENDGIGIGTAGIDSAFRSQEAQRIDVLIAVNKYQKGYDLKELTTVFLDKTIQEPSLINQIYTRPATKRRYKTIGYSIDLTLGNINRRTFDESIKLYDESESGAQQFITPEAIEEIQKAVGNTLSVLKVHLNLDATTFTKERILQAVLNPASDSDRQPRQAVFFKESKTLFKYIDQLKSPLYFKAQQLDIIALYDAFVDFKKIYADVTHRDHTKIKISLDSTMRDGYLNKSEIQSIIANVLGVMQEESMATLLEFKYDSATEMMAGGIESTALSDWVETQKKEERKSDLLKAMKLTESFLEEKDKTLYELVKALLDKLGDDRNLVYESATQEKIQNLLLQVQAHQVAFKEQLNSKYSGSAFVYYMVDSLQKAYPRLDPLVMLPLYVHVGRKINNVYLRTCGKMAQHLSVHEKIKDCAKRMMQETTDFQFTMSDLVPDYVKTLPESDWKAAYATLLKQLKEKEYTYDEFKTLSLGGDRVIAVITNVHKLQGHF